MEREVIVLAKSKKYGGYCVAGIDAYTGNWIRLVSTDRNSHGAVPKHYMRDQRGNAIGVLDKIKVRLKQYVPDGHQIENYIYDESFHFIKQGTVELNSIVAMIQQKLESYIFYNDKRLISEEDAKQISYDRWHSLEWIQVKKLRIYTKYNSYRDNISYRGEIDYKGHHYSDLSITDEAFVERCKIEQTEILYNPFLVMSLGVAFEKDNCHYKLIATVLENKKERNMERKLFGFHFNEVPF